LKFETNMRGKKRNKQWWNVKWEDNLSTKTILLGEIAQQKWRWLIGDFTEKLVLEDNDKEVKKIKEK